MWMMGCSDVSDSFNGRKIRPLIPKPSPSSSITTPIPPRMHATTSDHHFLMLNHHLEPSKRSDFNVVAPALVSSRWNPTPEQLQTLEELYRRGTRTPSADQIQQITAQLRRYGKIEGKNVFYWFQNHKARERQKRRRRSSESRDDQLFHTTQSLETKESGSSRTSYEVEQQAKNNWGFKFYDQESVSMQRSEVSERIQFQEEETQVQQQQQRRLVDNKQSTWHHHMMQVSCSPSLTPTFLNPIFLKPQRQFEHQEHQEQQESQTLELFPLKNGASATTTTQKEEDESITNTSETPHQFFEFL